MDQATMHRTRPRVSRRSTHPLREGITVGLIGAAIVMLWFFIVDLAAGVPLRTPALLGAAVFEGVRYADAVTPTALAPSASPPRSRRARCSSTGW